MKIEKQLQNMFSDEIKSPNADSFLNNFHSIRKQRARRTKNVSYGVSAFVVVLLVGVLTTTQLNKDNVEYSYYSDIEMTDEELDEYYDELAVYLVEESDDIWSTMEFFYEIENDANSK